MRRMHFLPFAALLAAAVPGAAIAQTLRLEDLRPGDRVRVDSPRLGADRLVGEVDRLTPDTLRVRAERGGDLVAVPVGAIARAAISLRQTSRGTLVRRSALIAAAGGGALGAAIALADRCSGPVRDASKNEEDCAPKAGQVVTFVAIGGAGGGLLGALVGSLLPTEHWDALALPPARVGLRPPLPGVRGWGVSVAVALGR